MKRYLTHAIASLISFFILLLCWVPPAHAFPYRVPGLAVPRTGTMLVILASAFLFFLVRRLLDKYDMGGSKNSGDFGLGRAWAFIAYVVLWLLPSLLGWFALTSWRFFNHAS